MADDATWMACAVDVARRGLGTTAPNPCVGAVIVRDGALLGSGHTRPPPGDHAEVVALRAARDAGHDPRGATLYSTLEPCCHHGRTPPCTDAILAAGIARVVVGVVDPFPPMRGKSLKLLEEQGVAVTVGVCAAESAAIVRGFVRAHTEGLPEVTSKVAVTLDGNIATASGESQWITGPLARQHGHRLRARHDAILVGIETVLADDPRLTCRVEEDADPTPVVVDSRLRIPADAALFRSPRRAVIFCAHDAPERDLPGDVVRVERSAPGIDMHAVLTELARRGLHRVLVEGGGRVHRSLLDRGLVDTLNVYVAGLVLPGGRPWVGGPPLQALADAPRFGAPEVEAFGPDVLLRYRLSTPDPETR